MGEVIDSTRDLKIRCLSACVRAVSREEKRVVTKTKRLAFGKSGSDV